MKIDHLVMLVRQCDIGEPLTDRGADLVEVHTGQRARHPVPLPDAVTRLTVRRPSVGQHAVSGPGVIVVVKPWPGVRKVYGHGPVSFARNAYRVGNPLPPMPAR